MKIQASSVLLRSRRCPKDIDRVEAFSTRSSIPLSLVILWDFCSISRLSLTEEPSNSCYDIDPQIWLDHSLSPLRFFLGRYMPSIEFHIAFGKARGSRPSPIIDRRGGLIILVPALIAVIVSDELGEGEDDYWCLELDSSRESSFQVAMLCPNHSLQKALKSSK